MKEEEVTERPPTEEDVGEDSKKRRRKRKRKSKNQDNSEEHDDEIVQDKVANEVDRTIFVEGLPYTATEDQIRKFFTDANITDISECRLPTWQDSGRLRGYGHIVFETVESKEAALKKNGDYMGSRYLSIQAAKAPRENEVTSEASKTIMLKSLSYDAKEEDVEDVMSKYGAIVEGGVRIVRNQNNMSKGFGYVEFEDLETAKKVIQNRPIILGRQCRVDYDHGRVKGSFKASSGKYWSKEYGNKRQK